MIVRMWEVKAHPEAFTEVLSWVCDYAMIALEADPNHLSSDVYSSADHRVVVVSKWRTAPRDPQNPPRHLVTREAHSWDFSPVDR